MRLAMVSTYPPRRCGLASYAQDLGHALRQDLDLVVCAVDRHGQAYPDEVIVAIDQDDAQDYRRAARVIAEHAVDAVLIQHEYGIFGGEWGEHVLALAEELREREIPYLVTLHTVLSRPSPVQARVLSRLTADAAAVTVFTETARQLAVASGVADAARIVVVPHGVPTIVRAAGELRAAVAEGAAGVRPPEPRGPEVPLRPQVMDVIEAVQGDRLLSTFGLLGPGKGLETAIAALPDVIDKHPDVRYLIAGATHPEVAREHGEAYRESLVALAEDLGISESVHFLDVFLTPAELAALLGRTDVYLTPYRSKEQSCSGALTYAIAAGCAVVSTDYNYAVEMLGSGAGEVVGVGDVPAFGKAVLALLDDSDRLDAAHAEANRIGAQLTWPAVARRLAVHVRKAVAGPPAPTARELLMPVLRLDQLRTLIDEIGIIQFAEGHRAALESGYCVDDVARQLIVAAHLLSAPAETVPPETAALAYGWITGGLRFLDIAFGPLTRFRGRHAAPDDPGDDGAIGMRNQMAYSGAWEDEPHLGDHVGRAAWGLGVVAACTAVPHRLRAEAIALRDRAAELVPQMPWLRANAYTLLGLAPATGLSLQTQAALAAAAGRLDEAWHRGDPKWRWYEERLTYDNARLPHAMIAAGHVLRDDGMVRRGIQSLDWYARQVGLATSDGVLRTVTNRWRGRDELPHPSGGDEQPIDAAATVEALVAAYRVTGEAHYGRLARRAFAWFLGANRFNASMYDEATGGCHDGVGPTWVNPNQGAESTLAYYQALFALVEADLARLPEYSHVVEATTAAVAG